MYKENLEKRKGRSRGRLSSKKRMTEKDRCLAYSGGGRGKKQVSAFFSPKDAGFRRTEAKCSARPQIDVHNVVCYAFKYKHDASFLDVRFHASHFYYVRGRSYICLMCRFCLLFPFWSDFSIWFPGWLLARF